MFIKGIRILFLFFSLCIVSASNAYSSFHNTYSFKQVSYEQGLPGINIRNQIQDKDGIMWICIESIGFCKYDGHKFTLFKHSSDNPQSISSNYVNMSAEDSNNNLWIATDYGLNKFDKNKNKFSVFLYDENDSTSIPCNICKFVMVDSKNRVWVGTENGIAVKDEKSDSFTRYFSYYDNSQNKSQLSVLSIKEQNENTFWIGSDNGLIKFNPQNEIFKKWNNDDADQNHLSDNFIIDLLIDNSEKLWIATYSGLDFMNLKTEQISHWTYEGEPDIELEKEGVSCLMLDKFNKLWLGTYTKGIVVIDTKTNNYNKITKENSGDSNLKSNHIRYIFEDKLGLVWIGTKFEGIFKYNDNIDVFNHWPQSQESLIPLRDSYILSFFEDYDHNYWVGSKTTGLYHVNTTTGKIINFQHNANNTSSICSNRIQAIYRDSQNKLWVGTNKGLNLMNEQNNSFNRISYTPVNWINEDHNGFIWIGTTTGVYTIDQFIDSAKRYNSRHPFFKSDNYEIKQIYCDRKGTVWFSTQYKGLFSYSHENDSLQIYKHNENSNLGVGGNMTRAILEDSKNRFWIGTKSQGLTLLNRETGEYIKYTTEDGLPSNMILSIEEDLNGNIWMGTHRGISKLNPEENTFTNYNSDYGLRSNIMEIGASHSFNTGELLFGGNDGFNIFDPNEIKPNNYLAPLFISSIKIDDIEIDKTTMPTNEIILDPKQRFISFEFSLTDYNSPYRHQYAVKLEGIDKNYRSLGNRNYITYSNLESGKYDFLLKGANEFGIWTKEPLKLNIIVKKPFYKLLWVRILSGILLLSIIVIMVIQIKKRQNTLERLINERTKKLEIAYKELLNKNTKIREQNRQIELQQANLEQKVTERTRDLEVAKSKAEESDRLKSSFLANISHEIRTPLNAITGFSALIGGDLYNPERKQKYINIIKTNTTSLLKLVEDLLDISRIEAEQLTIEKETFDFNNMIAELELIFQEEIRNKHDKKVKLFCERDINSGSSLMFFSDQARLRQILINLLNNAIKFTSNGEIRFGYKLEDGNILFWVKDTGIGIKKQYIDSIFNRFIKIENENVMYRGTGLGLSISKSLVNMLGGEIWVKSLENIGSSFYFNIPGEIQNNQIIANKPQQNIKVDLKDKTIIIVEFERSNYILLNSYFVGTNAKIVWANNNKSAIEMCQKDKFDLMILDFRVNDTESMMVFEKIKEFNSSLPILAQTSYATDEDKEKLEAIGFNDYIIKPFLKKDLLDKVARLI